MIFCAQHKSVHKLCILSKKWEFMNKAYREIMLKYKVKEYVIKVFGAIVFGVR
jgi:hypothetical protein